MGYQPGWEGLSGHWIIFVSPGDAEEVAVVVLSLSDLGNQRIKAS